MVAFGHLCELVFKVSVEGIHCDSQSVEVVRVVLALVRVELQVVCNVLKHLNTFLDFAYDDPLHKRKLANVLLRDFVQVLILHLYNYYSCR